MVSRLFAAETSHELNTQVEKESYSIGYQVGASIRSDSIEVSFEKLAEGLQDAMGDKEPRLSAGEMRAVIAELKKRAREAQLRRTQGQIVENAKESEKYLEENKKKEGVKTTGSGLQYTVLKEGEGRQPGPRDFVRLDYRGTFVDGKEFDTSYGKGEPARVRVDGVIKGWTEALPMMKVGSKWRLFLPPHLAYGRGGLGQRIPPNKALVFDVELLAVEEADNVPAQAGDPRTVRKINLTGEIARAQQGYIIRSRRGKAPSEIYTILNPDPKALDELATSGRPVSIEARIVSGDNVNIEKIDGKEYQAQRF